MWFESDVRQALSPTQPPFAVFRSANVCAFSFCMASYHFRFKINIQDKKDNPFPFKSI